MAGSSGVLAVDTLGFSSAQSKRDVRLSTTSDDDAYLSLAGDGVEVDGVLFGGDEPQTAPTTFDLRNHLPEAIVVTLECDAFEFDPVDSNGRVLDDGDVDLEPGSNVEVTVDLDSTPADGSETTDDIDISAAGEQTTIDATRELTLVPATQTATLTLCRGGSSNCVEVVIELIRDETHLEVDIEGRSDEGETTQTGGRIRRGDTRQFDLEVDVFGGGSGNWNVTAGTPSPEETNPGESVTLQLGETTIDIEPGDSVVFVTIAVDDETTLE